MDTSRRHFHSMLPVSPSEDIMTCTHVLMRYTGPLRGEYTSFGSVDVALQSPLSSARAPFLCLGRSSAPHNRPLACTCPISCMSCASAEAAIASMTSGRSMTLEGWMEQELEWQGITLKGRGTRRWLGSG